MPLHPTCSSEWPTLTSDHGRNTTTTMLERPSTYIQSWEEHIQEPCRKGPALTFDHEKNTSNTMSERHARHSHLTMGGTHPRTISERPSTYIHEHDRTHLLSSVKRHSTHIHQHDRTHLLSSMERCCNLTDHIRLPIIHTKT